MAHDPLLASILQDHSLILVLPFSLLDVLKTVRVSNGEILAENLNVINGLFQIIMNVLFDGQNCLVLVCKFQLLRELIHPQVLIIIRERQKLELKIYIRGRILLAAVSVILRRHSCRSLLL